MSASIRRSLEERVAALWKLQSPNRTLGRGERVTLLAFLSFTAIYEVLRLARLFNLEWREKVANSGNFEFLLDRQLWAAGVLVLIYMVTKRGKYLLGALAYLAFLVYGFGFVSLASLLMGVPQSYIGLPTLISLIVPSTWLIILWQIIPEAQDNSSAAADTTACVGKNDRP